MLLLAIAILWSGEVAAAQDVVHVVGRLISAPSAPPACSGAGGTGATDETVTMRYEIVYARPSSGLPDRIEITAGCAQFVASGKIQPAHRRPVFAAGELHDLQLRIPRAPPRGGPPDSSGTRFAAVEIAQRAAPVATRISTTSGYHPEQIGRHLERKLGELPCGSAGAEVSVAVRVKIVANGCMSSMDIDPASPAALRACMLRATNKCAWDFGYAMRDGRGRIPPQEVSFAAVFPRASDSARHRRSEP